MGPYDWHFDRDHDGTLDFHEDYERMDFDDFVSKRGIYEEEEDEEDDEFELETGYSREDLELMDDDEREEVLKDAGIDPDDWDDI